MKILVFRRPHGRDPSAGDGHSVHASDAPSPLVPGAAPIPVPIRQKQADGSLHAIAVLWHLLGLWFRLRWLRLTRRHTDARAGSMARATLEDLGGLWVKVGQLMSLRTDVLPEAICRELATLQSRVEGFDPELSRRTVEEELGKPLERVFASFERDPFAAASMAQVHRAVLRANGEQVVVKVQRPGLEESFERDLRFLRTVVRVLGHFHIASNLRLGDLLHEVGDIMREEVDYRYEANNLRRLRHNLRAHGVIAPTPRLRHCTRRVLVAQFLPGVQMSDYIALRRADPARADAWLRENGINPRAVARELVASLLRQVFEDNLFHGDLHPGNIMLFRGGRVGFIDFGSAGTLERQVLDIYALAIGAIVDRNFRRAADYILFLCASIPAANLAQVREEMVRSFRAWEARSGLHGASYFERALSSINAEINAILFRNRIAPSWALLKLGRTLGTLDATLSVLVPRGDIRRLYAAYFVQARRRARNPVAVLRRVAAVQREVMHTVQEFRTLVLPYVRGRVLSVRGAADRFARAQALLLRYLRIGFIAAALVLIYWVLRREDRALVRGIGHPTLDAYLSRLPDLHTWDYLLIALALLVMARLARRTATILRAES